MITQEFNIDFVPGRQPVTVNVVQGDHGTRTLKANLYAGDGAFRFPDGVTVTICGTKPSGTGFSYPDIATIETNGTRITSITFDCTKQMTAVAGRVTVAILVKRGSDVLQSARFYLQVQEKALKDKTIVDSNDFIGLVDDAVADYLEASGMSVIRYDQAQALNATQQARARENMGFSGSTDTTDTTLTESNIPADAKATGDRIKALEEATIETDKTLSVAGAAADAKAVGDMLSSEYEEIKVELVQGEYVGATYDNGAFIKYSGWARSGYIPVPPGDTIKYFAAAASDYCYLYDAGKNPVKAVSISSGEHTLAIPAGCAFFAVSDMAANMAQFRIWGNNPLIDMLNNKGVLLSGRIKAALLALFGSIAYSIEDGAVLYNALLDALYPGSGTSDMNGWSTGVPYTNLEIVTGSYASAGTGKITSYSGWDRTGYIPCGTAKTIKFAAMPQVGGPPSSNCFYDASKGFISSFTLSKTAATTIYVPNAAAFFILSSESAALAACIEGGITPSAV